MLHHLALAARNVELVASFYRDVLGLPELTRHYYEDGRLRSVWLDLDGPLLMIEHTDAAPPSSPDRAGLFMLALRVETGERARFEHNLESAGAIIEARTAYTSYARDPEGNRIAISHFPELPSDESQ